MPPTQLLRLIATTSHRTVRLVLVLLLGLWSSLHILSASEGSDMDRKAYDQMVKQRLFTPAADPKIVIVDIDEASLEQLKGEFGRWPWPRETLAAALEWLTRQGAQAVVFDILFADLDTLNPGSDAAFVASVAQSANSYFPILRLNADNDGLSQVRASQLSGFATPVPVSANTPTDTASGASPASKADTAPTVAVTPPVFDAIVRSGRMGYHNIYPDADGVNRHYQLWEDKADWRLWSLPARIARDLQWPLPKEPKQLIQFTRSKTEYLQVPFAEVWKLSQSREGLRSDPRFANAIVLIGSTATSLFDVKVSPLDVVHPGVMILANVIDNLKNQRFLHQMPMLGQLLMAWLALGLVAWASTRLREDQAKWAIPVAPGLFLGIGFLSLHSGLDVYLDLTASASHALLFFTVWAAYLNWRTQYFSGQDGQRPLSALADDKRAVCFALLAYGAQRPTMPLIHDAIGHLSPSACVAIQVGAMGVLPHQQDGLAYLRVAAPLGVDARALMQDWIDRLEAQPLAVYIGAQREENLENDKHWQTIWRDVCVALQHMELKS